MWDDLECGTTGIKGLSETCRFGNPYAPARLTPFVSAYHRWKECHLSQTVDLSRFRRAAGSPWPRIHVPLSRARAFWNFVTRDRAYDKKSSRVRRANCAMFRHRFNASS